METYDWKNGLAWPGKLRTGNEKIDGQHKMIFQLISDLVDARIIGESKEIFGEKLVFLVNYTVDHFYHEEKLMIEINYPNYKNHKKLHDDFKITVLKLKGEFDSGGASNELVKSLENAVIRWVIKHIQYEDMNIVSYLSAIKLK